MEGKKSCRSRRSRKDGCHRRRVGLKANFDGAVYKQGAMCGVGAVLRDHSGAFRAATCHLFDGIADPEVAEIYACKRAL